MSLSVRLGGGGISIASNSIDETVVPRGGLGDFLNLMAGRSLQPFTGEVSFEDPADAAEPFSPHYEERIRPKIDDFEERRISALRRCRPRLFLFLPGAVVIGAGSALLSLNVGDFWPAVIGLLLIVGLWVWTYLPISKFRTAIKQEIYPLIFEFFDGGFSYDKGGHFTVDSLKPSGIIPSYDDEYTEDSVRGAYKGVDLELTEAKMTETRGSGKNRHTVTVFRGMFVLFNVHKSFDGKTIIKTDKGAIANWFGDKFSSLENVDLEDPVFEKKFEVYSDDQVEARYLLTPSFMQRLLDLTGLLGGTKVQASFYDNRLLLMISSRENRFETGSAFKPATFVDEINTILKEMSLIFQMIDTLKLDQSTGL